MTTNASRRVFGVDYQFLSCGSVFTDGLAHAAVDLGITYDHAPWDCEDLSDRINALDPDMVFVVHGRRFSQRFPRHTSVGCRTAVWLLDEPYEVDDTATFSPRFDAVFVSDRATLPRHHRATYLPVCYDPHVHRPGLHPRIRRVGFIGGGNATRERYLSALAQRGLLDYVVGGDWSDPAINAVCLGRNIRPAATAELYGVTKIVLNVFRETHHFNRGGIAATAMNPRIYEALACGALVVSEWRPEIAELVPELPTFTTEAECVALVAYLLAAPDKAEAIRAACAARLASHTYADRLQTVLATVCAEVAA
jgi:hypothetical protein